MPADISATPPNTNKKNHKLQSMDHRATRPTQKEARLTSAEKDMNVYASARHSSSSVDRPSGMGASIGGARVISPGSKG